MVENGLAGPTAGLIATTNVPLSGGVPNFPQGASGVVNYTFDLAAYKRNIHCDGHLQIDLGSFRGDYVNLGPCSPPPPPPPPLLCSLDAFSEIGTIHLVNDRTAEINLTVKPGYSFPVYFAAYVIPGPGQTPQILVNQTITKLTPGPHTLDIALQTNSGISWQVDLGCSPFPNPMTDFGQYPTSDLIAGLRPGDSPVSANRSLVNRSLRMTP